MFLARRPSPKTVDRFLRESQDLPLSYGPIGLVKAEAGGQDLDEATVTIGRGKADFKRARAALARVGQPIVRALQTRFRSHSGAAMERATRANGDGR